MHRSGTGFWHSPRALFEHLCDRNAVTHNPAKGVARPRSETGEGKTPALGDHQASKLLDAPDGNRSKLLRQGRLSDADDSARNKRDRPILSTLLFHALRREELCKLKVKDFRHARKRVPHLGRGGKRRYLPLPAGTNGLINDYLDAAGHGEDVNGALFRPVRNNATGALDKAITPDGVYKLVRAYSAELGFAIGARALRATARPRRSTTRPTLAKCRSGLGTLTSPPREFTITAAPVRRTARRSKLLTEVIRVPSIAGRNQLQPRKFSRRDIMRWVRKLIDEFRLISPTALMACLLYILVGFVLFLTFRDNTTLIGSLAPNLFAGSIDTLFAVILITYIIARSARREHRPMRFAAYLQAASALHLLRLTWFDMIKASSIAMPPVGADLLDERYFDEVARHLDLDKPSGILETAWVSRATAAGMQIKEAVGRMISRHASALSPDTIVKCTAFENSSMVSNLASLQMMDTSFVVKHRITMQQPFILAYSKEDLAPVREFIVMVGDLAKEFEGEAGYRAPVSFSVTPEMNQGRFSVSPLGSARVD
jgi:hypothetical protein